MYYRKKIYNPLLKKPKKENPNKPQNSEKQIPPLRPLTLQQLLGNREVARMFQEHEIMAKLLINQPGDVFEQEADRVAEQIVAMDSNENNLKPEEIKIQKKSSSSGNQEIPSQTEAEINALNGKGRPMERHYMEYYKTRFGVDFDDIKIHTESNADRLARAVKARAFTYGTNIVFAKNQYNPDTKVGKKLIAHELTHVIQQGVNQRPGDKNNNSSLISAKNSYFDFTGTSPGTSLKTDDTCILSDLIKMGRFDIMEYAYFNKPARQKSIEEIEKNKLAYIPALPFHYKNYNPLEWTFVQGANYIQFTKDKEKDPKTYYLVWTKLEDGVATVLDSVEFKAGTTIPYGNDSFTIDELWDFSKTAREEFVGRNKNGEQKSAWLTLCNYAFGITAKEFSGSHLRNPESGGIFSIGDILKNMYNNKNNTEDYVYVETDYRKASDYAGLNGYAVALNAHPAYWHGAIMLGFDRNKIPQVFNAGWASWGTGRMNLGAAFGYNVEGSASYNKPEMHYFVLIKNPAKKQ